MAVKDSHYVSSHGTFKPQFMAICSFISIYLICLKDGDKD